MIRLSVLNMRNFLQVVSTYDGCITVISYDGSKKDINKQYATQHNLLNEYRENENSPHLSLGIPNLIDYMSIVSYYAEDC